MSRGLIAVGTGVASCAGTAVVYLSTRAPLPGACVLSGIAASALGLAAERGFKEKPLDKKDYILIGGAGVVGSLAGGAAVIALVTATAFLAIGSLWGALMGTVMGNILMLPLRALSAMLLILEPRHHRSSLSRYGIEA